MNWNFRPIASVVFGGLLVATVACTSDPQSPGVEYMPDMYRSPAVEAYVDYAHADKLSARRPVPGTIPFSTDSFTMINSLPYTYPNTAEGYEAAGANVVSPLPTTKQYIDEGKALYSKFCMHCHGETGKGDGPVVTNGGYPPPPAYDGPQLKGLPEGKMFHSVTYGKGVAMGPHNTQLSKLERWKIIQYVKVLQNGGKSPFDSAAPAGDTTQVKI